MDSTGNNYVGITETHSHSISLTVSPDLLRSLESDLVHSRYSQSTKSAKGQILSSAIVKMYISTCYVHHGHTTFFHWCTNTCNHARCRKVEPSRFKLTQIYHLNAMYTHSLLVYSIRHVNCICVLTYVNICELMLTNWKNTV